MQSAVNDILSQNDLRLQRMFANFDPITGEGSVGKRRKVELADFPIRVQWLPLPMLSHPVVRKLMKAASVERFITDVLNLPYSDQARLTVIDEFVRIRCRYDFPFWAATFVHIKNKSTDGTPEILFRLTYPQRLFVEHLESQRLAGKPIRTVLLKARQWGGSTTSQLYMAWLQLCLRPGLNSLIVAHQGSASDEIKDMFNRMIRAYPLEMLHKRTDTFPANEAKTVSVGKSGAIIRVPQRDCNIKIGTAESPDSTRGGNSALIHLSEVAFWKKTDGKAPEDIVRSATGGTMFREYTMIVYESTANGLGNFFHQEYEAARKGESQFQPLFIPWFAIDWNRIDFSSEQEREAFARRLYENRLSDNARSNRHEPGRFLWWLWEKGASLEAINWYINERRKYNSHGAFAAECPSDDIEAFVNSGAAVFDKYLVEAFRPQCMQPRLIGDVYGKATSGEEALEGLRFCEDAQGALWVWSLPDPYDPTDNEDIAGRYLTVVDIGGRSSKADWSVIVVFDRIGMLDGDPPVVVAQWYGHSDIDILAWRAAQIAAFYDNSLLVIESNTLETHDPARQVDGDQSLYVLSQIGRIYPNLYAREQSEDQIRLNLPRQFGFHTNTRTKPLVIANLVKMIREHSYIERDERCLNEYLTYERRPNGSFGAIPGRHDDLLMTRAIGLYICFNKMDLPEIVPRIIDATYERPISAATI